MFTLPIEILVLNERRIRMNLTYIICRNDVRIALLNIFGPKSVRRVGNPSRSKSFYIKRETGFPSSEKGRFESSFYLWQ